MYLLEIGFLAHFTSYIPYIHTYLLHTSREMCDTWVSVLLRANGEKQKTNVVAGFGMHYIWIE